MCYTKYVLVLTFVFWGAACSQGVQSGTLESKFIGIQAGTAVSPTAINLNWDKSGSEISYDVYLSTQKTPLLTQVFTKVTIESLAPDTEYTFKVIANTSAGADREVTVRTWPRFQGLTKVEKNSDGHLVLSWTYPYSVSEYQVFVREETAPTAASTNNWATPNYRTADQQIVLKDLKPSTLLYFVVHAKYRDGEFERPTATLAGTTDTSFPFPTFGLSKVTIGSLPFISIDPVTNAQFSLANYTSQIFRDNSQVSDPVVGKGTMVFSNSVPLSLGKVDNISLKVRYHDSALDQTLTIRNLETYLKGVGPKLDLPPIQSGLGEALVGKSLAVGDFNCDGYDDLAVGLPDVSLGWAGQKNAQSGVVYIYYGGYRRADGRYVLKTSAEVTGLEPSRNPALPGQDPQIIAFDDLSYVAKFGYSMSTGNANGDTRNGYKCADLLVGAPGQDSPGVSHEGNAFLFYGSSTGLKSATRIADLPNNIETCDGLPEGATCGAVRLWPDYSLWPNMSYKPRRGSTTGQYDVQFGTAVSFIGDYNADGYQDFAIGAPYADWDGIKSGSPSSWYVPDVGYVAVYFGSQYGLGTAYADSTRPAAKFRFIKIFPPVVEDRMYFGSSIAGGVDVDGASRRLLNGTYVGGADFVVGAPGYRYLSKGSLDAVVGILSTAVSPDTVPALAPFGGGYALNNLARFGFSSTPTAGSAFLFFGRDASDASDAAFLKCGRRAMNSGGTYQHFSCMVDNNKFRMLFPRDHLLSTSKSYDFGRSVAMIGEDSVRRSTDNIHRCASAVVAAGDPSTGASVSPYACKDANGDGYGEVIVAAPQTMNGTTMVNSGAIWEFFGNPNKYYEASDTWTNGGGLATNSPDLFGFTTSVDVNANTDANCTTFALVTATNAVVSPTPILAQYDLPKCAPTVLKPNSIASGSYLGKNPGSLAVGELTGDTILDLAVGAPNDSTNGTNAGSVYVFTSTFAKGLTKNLKKMNRQTSNGYDQLGYSVAVGDFDPKLGSYRDVVAGAPYDDIARNGGGAVHLFLSQDQVLPAIKTIEDLSIVDTFASAQEFGHDKMKIVGDINGDGYDDAVGRLKSYSSSGSAVYDAAVYFGSAIGLITTDFCVQNATRVLGTGGNTSQCYPQISRTQTGSYFLPQQVRSPLSVGTLYAELMYGIGDVNGDGFADVAFLSPGTNAVTTAYYGSSGGLQDLNSPSKLPSRGDPQIISSSTSGMKVQIYSDSISGNNYSAFDLVKHGDFNKDGYEDFVISSPGLDGRYINKRAKVWQSDATNAPYVNSATIPFFGVVDPGLSTQYWACGIGDTTPDCMAATGEMEAGGVYIFYGSAGGVWTPAIQGATGTNDKLSFDADMGSTSGYSTVANYFVEAYGSEDIGGGATASGGVSIGCKNTGICKVQYLRNPVHENYPYGYNNKNHFGASIEVMDVNGDGTDDLVVSAPGFVQLPCTMYDTADAEYRLQQGRVYVFYGSATYGLRAGEQDQYYFGRQMALDAGFASVNETNSCILPATIDTALGLNGKLMRAIQPYYHQTPALNPEDSLLISGNIADRQFGRTLAAVGDINGDGKEDLVMGSGSSSILDPFGAQKVSSGSMYVYYGPICGTDNNDAIAAYTEKPANLNRQAFYGDASKDPAISGETIEAACGPSKTLAPQKFAPLDVQAGEYFGSTVVGARLKTIAGSKVSKSDVNLDTYGDVIVGGSGWTDPITGNQSVGRGVIYFGGQSGLYTAATPSSTIETLTPPAGYSGVYVKPFNLVPAETAPFIQFFKFKSTSGDVNGDGSNDFLSPSPYYSGRGSTTGVNIGTVMTFY